MHRLLACVLLLIVLAAPTAMAERRLALVIGIDDYQEVPTLKKAVGDAQAVAAALEKIGFAVTLATDTDRRSLNRSLAEFERALGPGDTALVHYSGHGVEIDGENYLLPADIPRPRSGNRNFVKDETIGLTAILGRLRDTGAATRIVIVDACRDNPFAEVGVRAVGGSRGLSRVEAPKGTFVLYSAGYGQLALDRLGDQDPEPTSVFTRVLLRHIAVEGREITDIAKDVRAEVSTLAAKVGHDQFPAYYDELAGRFVLLPGTGAPPLPAPAPGGDPVPKQDGIRVELEVSYWKAIEASREIADFKAYLQRVEKGEFTGLFSDLARNRIRALQPADTVQPSPPKFADTARRGPSRIYTEGYNGPTFVKGSFTRVAVDRWEERNSENGDTVLQFRTQEQSRDSILLYDESRKLWLKLDLKKKSLSWRLDGNQSWNRLYDIVRIEGGS